MDDLALYGHDMFGEIIKPPASGIVAERFTVPPFTILDAKQGEWQNRKRAWQLIGIRGEIGRECEGGNAWNDLGLNPRKAESSRKIASVGNGPTIFDPVLCEIMYKWFNKKGGQIIDPFAGGSVRGIVAGMLGMKYWGCDLRQEQIQENQKQAEKIYSPP